MKTLNPLAPKNRKTLLKLDFSPKSSSWNLASASAQSQSQSGKDEVRKARGVSHLRRGVGLAMMLILLGSAGGGYLCNQALGAEPEAADKGAEMLGSGFVGYVLSVGKGDFLVTGRSDDEGDTATIYSFENVEKTLRVGMEVKVWCISMEQSYPAQANALRIEVLDPKKPATSQISRLQAIQKAIAELGQKDLSVTFVRRATYDEAVKEWKVAIDVGRDLDREVPVRSFDFVVAGDGLTVRKELRAGVNKDDAKIAPGAEKPDRLLTPAEAHDSTVANIAESAGLSKEDAASVLRTQQIFSEIHGQVAQEFSAVYLSAVVASTPDGESRILIKGPAPRELRDKVSKAPIKIKIVDNQKYSVADLEAMREKVYVQMEKLGYEVLLSYWDMEPICRMSLTVQGQKGRPNTVEEVLKLMPADLAPLLNLTLVPPPEIIVPADEP